MSACDTLPEMVEDYNETSGFFSRIKKRRELRPELVSRFREAETYARDCSFDVAYIKLNEAMVAAAETGLEKRVRGEAARAAAHLLPPLLGIAHYAFERRFYASALHSMERVQKLLEFTGLESERFFQLKAEFGEKTVAHYMSLAEKLGEERLASLAGEAAKTLEVEK